MKKRFIKIVCTLLAVLMTSASSVQIFAAETGEGADYSISPDYAARYPHGVIEFHNAKITVNEGNEAELKLIRTGGTEGEVTVMLKAVDISAGFGINYDVKVGSRRLKQDGEYTGTLVENYLEESGGDYITSDDMLTDEVYQQIICYKDAELSDEEAAELCGASVGLISDTLGVSEEKAMEIVGLTEKTEKKLTIRIILPRCTSLRTAFWAKRPRQTAWIKAIYSIWTGLSEITTKILPLRR